MQYILTQEEYDGLKKKQELAIKLNKDMLQALCTKIAKEMPVSWYIGRPPKPQGCVLDNSACYCDDCPVQDICPSTRKDWSQ